MHCSSKGVGLVSCGGLQVGIKALVLRGREVNQRALSINSISQLDKKKLRKQVKDAADIHPDWLFTYSTTSR